MGVRKGLESHYIFFSKAKNVKIREQYIIKMHSVVYIWTHIWIFKKKKPNKQTIKKKKKIITYHDITENAMGCNPVHSSCKCREKWEWSAVPTFSDWHMYISSCTCTFHMFLSCRIQQNNNYDPSLFFVCFWKRLTSMNSITCQMKKVMCMQPHPTFMIYVLVELRITCNKWVLLLKHSNGM